MRAKLLSRLFIVVLLLVPAFTVIRPFPVREVQAQQAPFLITPYYGTIGYISSYFDHEYPTYYFPPNGDGQPGSQDRIFTRHDGQRWTELTNCILGVNCYDGHNGNDFALAYEAVLAAADGIVEEAEWDSTADRTAGYGLYVVIMHDNGYRTRYAHLSSAIASIGQSVYAGQVIGTSGDTGNSEGPHLHFDVRDANGRAVDPFGWSGAGTDPWAQHASGATSYCLWQDGEWAHICGGISRSIPAPISGGEITVDDNPDNDNGFSKGMDGPFNNPCTGSGCPYWNRATGSWLGAHDDDMYWTNDNDNTPDYWAKWRPSLPRSGIYEVYIHVPSYNGITWQAPYTVVHTYGQTQATVDQLGLVDRWVSIGVYHFDPGGYVYITDATGELNHVRQVGVDAVKFVRRGTTYLPDIQTSGGWTSSLYVSSNGGTARVRVTFFDNYGIFKGASTVNVSGHANQAFSGPHSAAWALVEASQDVSVEVENKHTSTGRYNNYNGITPGDFDPGWGQTGADIYVPLVKYEYGSTAKTSRFHILNTGSSNAVVTINAYTADDDPGYVQYNPSLAPHALWTPGVVGSGPVRYAAWIDSNQPLAVVVTEENHNDSTSRYKTQNVFASGATSVFVPQVKHHWANGDFTTLAVQNTGSNSTDVTVTYYPHTGGTCGHSAQIESKKYYIFRPQDVPGCPSEPPYNGFVGSARVTSDGQPLAVSVNERGEKGYSGFLAGSQTIVLPTVRRVNGWWTGIRVMNVDGGGSADLTLNLYNQGGSFHSSVVSQDLGSFQSVNLGSHIPVDFNGSATISATRPAVAAVTLSLNGGDSVRTMMYNGNNR